MVSWPCCFWAYFEIKFHGREHVLGQAAHLLAAKGKEEEDPGSYNSL
jgi:hypothetical protein